MLRAMRSLPLVSFCMSHISCRLLTLDVRLDDLVNREEKEGQDEIDTLADFGDGTEEPSKSKKGICFIRSEKRSLPKC